MTTLHRKPAKFNSFRRRRVCLLLEGSYPYVAGEASAWVHQLITSMPDIDFDLHFLADQKKHHQTFQFELPRNVLSLSETYLLDPLDPSQQTPGSGSKDEKAALLRMVSRFLEAEDTDSRTEALCAASTVLRRTPDLVTLADLLKDPNAWKLITEAYRNHAPDAPFFRFHAAARDLATTLWSVIRTVSQLPPADTYHAVAHGYASLMGAIAARLHGSAFLLSEHGVFLEKSIEDLRNSSELAEAAMTYPLQGSPGHFPSLWTGFFDLLSQVALDNTSAVSPLLGTRPTPQPETTAAGRTSAPLTNRKAIPPSHSGPLTVGFRGQISPGSDIKTLLHAASLTLKAHPEVEFLFAGPLDADPDYHAECCALIRQLGISDKVSFADRMRPAEFLAQADIVTSTSERLPFAILEASAAGRPVVATDTVGNRELLENPLTANPSTGSSGVLTPAADPSAMATALCELIGNHELRMNLGQNGIQRASSMQNSAEVTARYRALYVSLAPGFVHQILSA
jgi:glycosyltransferase involved in cell wall biosynthesis